MSYSGTHLQRYIRLFIFIVFICASLVSASDLTSTSFIVRDPVVGAGGGFGTSANFKLYDSLDLTLLGRGTSASYEGRYGFLWYPYVTQGVFSVSLSSGTQVDLTWGASAAGLGYNISGYSVGNANVSGGPYTYTNVGNVTNISYPNLTPGLYCYVLRTLDAFSNVIATSPEQCVTVQPSLTLSISANAVQFGAFSSAAARYATTSGGSATNSIAHTIIGSSNATSGYTITYFGPTLTSNANTITPATIVSDADGAPGTSQFALSLSTSGSATIPSAYQQAGSNWKYAASTTTTIATTPAPSAAETYSVRYLGNTAPATPAGSYRSTITYVITGNF